MSANYGRIVPEAAIILPAAEERIVFSCLSRDEPIWHQEWITDHNKTIREYRNQGWRVAIKPDINIGKGYLHCFGTNKMGNKFKATSHLFIAGIL